MLLRPRQTEFVARAVAALRERGNALAVAPTGFGKTVAMAAIIGRLLAGGGRALVLQHRQELVAQNIEKFRIINPAIPATVVDASAKDFEGRTVFAMVPTLARPRTLDLLRPVDLLVIDEAHHAAAETYRRIIDHAREINPAVRVLGLTATPRRADRKALRDIFDNLADQVTLGELIQSGHLVRPRTFVVDLGVQKQLLAVKRRAADFDPEEVDAILNHEPINASVVEHWREKARGRPTVAFTSTVAHAQVPPPAVECPLCGERLVDEVARLVNFELVELDLFDRSNFAWTDVSPGQDGANLKRRDGAAISVSPIQKDDG